MRKELRYYQNFYTKFMRSLRTAESGGKELPSFGGGLADMQGAPLLSLRS